jgi:6-phosphogluconolactonase
MKKISIEGLAALSPLVLAHLDTVASQHGGGIRIGVPGGRSAAPLIQGLLSADDSLLARVQLYLVDERIAGDRNLDTLLAVGLAQAIATGRMTSDQLVVPQLGGLLLPEGEHLDLLYLGVGEDGHIASLFPGSYPELDARTTAQIVVVADSPKPPLERVTLSYRGFRTIAKQAHTYLLFFGEGKRNALDRLLAGKENPSSLPCMFFPHEWFTVDIITDLQEMRA